ncbi:Reverse transcriptase zinc-binding domain [Macleaya cordata]|uniref:Reverse transcriptase zinc-binding domain n=1 Tax=Macleaya cordata TaxID=56857 RepID=A0A200PU05_MACCD|nr:Reverse transcriptase zinc-binding domain [Macleaya cordata]
MLARMINIKNQGLGEKYLGAPIIFLRSKTQTHLSLLKSIDNRINSWSNRFLSQAGRTSLVKAIDQAIPLYQMAAFLIPKNLCRKIDSHLCKYWWGESLDPNDKKIHLLAWDNICKPVSEGGLGIRKSEINNIAMLARNAWRLLENPESLWGKTLKAKYFKNSDFLHANCPNSASWAWKCLHFVKEKIKPFISWIVGDGKFIDPWCDRWIPDCNNEHPQPQTPHDTNIKVADFIDQTSRSWDRGNLQIHFDQSSIEKIVRIPLSSVSSSDRRAWDLTRDGRFISKSIYLTLRGVGNNQEDKLWKGIWKSKMPHRVQLFTWKCAKNALPVRDLLSQRININTNLCPRCQAEPKTITHALLTCTQIATLWSNSRMHCCTDPFVDKPISDWLRSWLAVDPYRSNVDKIEHFPLVASLMWSIWMSRNILVFNNKIETDIAIQNRAHRMLPKPKFQKQGNNTTSQSQLTNHARLPPPAGWVKVNCDGAWDPVTKCGG